MKKITILLFFFFLTIPLFAQDDEIAWNIEDIQNVIVTPDEDVIWVYEISEKEEEEVIKKKAPFRVPDRNFETGLFNFGLGFSNNFMTASEIFKEKAEIDINKLSDGFKINFNFALSPIYISYNKDDIWGFGFTTGLDLTGNIDLNGNMLIFNEADSVKSDIGAAAFAEMKIHSFFTLKKIKFKVKPAMYYPILYAKPNTFSYTFKDKDGINKTILHIAFDMQVYTAFPMEGDSDITDIFNIKNITDKKTAKPGFDIGIGAEYPLSEELDLITKYDFLDFDVVIDFINIPVYPSEMEDYRQMIVNIGSDEPIDFFNRSDDDSEENDEKKFLNYKFDNYGKEKRNVFRPFKMLISANWRPLDNPFLTDSDVSFKFMREWLTLTPILGFAINPLYYQPVSFEGGIKTRLNLFNFFIATLGIGYYDRLWKNSFDIALNFRLCEIDFGVGMQSPSFLKSWSGGGFGATLGLKFGW